MGTDSNIGKPGDVNDEATVQDILMSLNDMKMQINERIEQLEGMT